MSSIVLLIGEKNQITEDIRLKLEEYHVPYMFSTEVHLEEKSLVPIAIIGRYRFQGSKQIIEAILEAYREVKQQEEDKHYAKRSSLENRIEISRFN